MKRLLSWIGGVLKAIVGIADKTAEQIKELSQFAVPIVEEIAAETEGRTDDKIVEFYKKYGLENVEKYLALPPEDRGQALLNAATKLLLRRFPYVPTTLVQAAIQLVLAKSKTW